MSFAQDFAAGSGLFNNIWQMSEDAKDRKRKQEWEDETRGIIRKDRAALEEARTGAQRYLDEQAALGGGEFKTGLRISDGQRPVAHGGVVDPQQAAQYNQANPPAAPQELGLSRGKSFSNDVDMYRTGVNGMDIGQIMQMRRDLNTSRIGSERSAIENHILSAAPEERAKLLQQVSLDRGNKFKVTPDPRNPNLFVVTEGNEKVEMDARQLATFFGANHALKNGDHTALNDIKGLMPEFAARVKESYDHAKGTATNAKENFDSISADNYRNRELGLRGQQISQQGQRDRMSSVQYFQDPKTKETKAYIPSIGKSGVTWTEVETPTGMVPIKPGGRDNNLSRQEEIAYGELVKVASNLPPDTPPAQIAGLYRQFGLDPVKFGVKDPLADIAAAIKAKAEGGGSSQPPATGPTPTLGVKVPYAKQAHQAWIDSQPSYFQQETPTSRAKTEAAYQEYLRALRDPNYNGPAR